MGLFEGLIILIIGFSIGVVVGILHGDIRTRKWVDLWQQSKNREWDLERQLILITDQIRFLNIEERPSEYKVD